MKNSPFGSQFIEHSDNFRCELADSVVNIMRYCTCTWNQGSKAYKGPLSGITAPGSEITRHEIGISSVSQGIEDQPALDNNKSIKMRFFSNFTA